MPISPASLFPLAKRPIGDRIWRKPFWVGVAAGALLLCLAKPASAGTVTITMIENAGSISVSLSGSIDYGAAGQNYQSGSSGALSNFIGPANGTISFGISSALFQKWETSSGLAVQSTSPTQTLAPNALFSPYG